MNVPLITWSVIAGLFLLMVIVRMAQLLAGHIRMPRHILSMGSEREEMFVPGDIIKVDEHDIPDYGDL